MVFFVVVVVVVVAESQYEQKQYLALNERQSLLDGTRSYPGDRAWPQGRHLVRSKPSQKINIYDSYYLTSTVVCRLSSLCVVGV